MNKCYYEFGIGNPFRAKRREHYCYKCGTKLYTFKHHKVVSQKSEEAKYYDFSYGLDDGVRIGPCDFVHKVFFCIKCSEDIEFVTQLNQEDIDIIIDKVKMYFSKKGRIIEISKSYENKDGSMQDKIANIELIANLCFIIEENGREPLTYKVPLSRMEY